MFCKFVTEPVNIGGFGMDDFVLDAIPALLLLLVVLLLLLELSFEKDNFIFFF
jgi:hypothetical protein